MNSVLVASSLSGCVCGHEVVVRDHDLRNHPIGDHNPRLAMHNLHRENRHQSVPPRHMAEKAPEQRIHFRTSILERQVGWYDLRLLREES